MSTEWCLSGRPELYCAGESIITYHSVLSTQYSEPITVLGVFDDDAFNNISYVLATVYGRLELFINFFPFQHGQWIVCIVKEFGDGRVVNIVPFIFQPVNFNQPLRHVLGPF